jgi:hypothetical protein
MSGFPAFQSSAFQVNSFQSGVSLVTADFSIGSPVFSTPAIKVKYQLVASAYWTASPSFAAMHIGGLNLILHANNYSIGSPVFTAPSLRSVNRVNTNSYSIGSPVFSSTVAVIQKHVLFTNKMAVGSPDFGAAKIVTGYPLIAKGFSVGNLIWSSAVGPITTKYVLVAAPYWLDSPRFGYPRLQWSIVSLGLPPTYLTQVQDAAKMLNGLLDLLMASVPNIINDNTNTARRLISILQGNEEQSLRDGSLGTQLQNIYQAIADAGATYTGIEAARQYLMSQVANDSLYTQALFRSALIMTLSAESVAITNIKFTNRDDVQLMVLHAQDMFETAKAIGIDEVDILIYQTLNALGGKLISYLANTALQLPRFVEYDADFPMPSLYLAQRIYRDPTRSDEIESENAVVHPAFCPTRLRVLSNFGS